MTSFTNRPIIWNAEAGTVIGHTEKRSRVLLTVKLNSGRIVKVDSSSVEFTDVERFAPATGFVDCRRRPGGHYGDVTRMFARSSAWKD